MTGFSINPNRNYILKTTGDIFTGRQMQNLAELAESVDVVLVAMLAMDTEPTDEPPTQPDTKYGPASWVRS